MIRSMTGYALVERETPWGVLTWELRSINHRFLDISLRLPEDLRVLEGRVRERIQAKLARGKVDCTLRVKASAVRGVALHLDMELVTQLLSAAHTVASIAESAQPINALDILRWPGVIMTDAVNPEPEFALALDLLDVGLAQLIENRTQEGARLQAVLTERCAAISVLVEQVRTRLPEISTRLRQRLRDRLAELSSELDPQRLEQEILLTTQRMDVDEELARLTSHLAEARRVFNQPDPAGRRLDFLLQEFNREANTLGSKSIDAETSRLAVEMKVLIEQIREQVQNIE